MGTMGKYHQSTIVVGMLAVCVLTACTKSSVRQHPDFQARKAAISSILMVPPNVVITHGPHPTSSARSSKEEGQVAQDLQILIKKEIAVATSGTSGKEPRIITFAELSPGLSIPDEIEWWHIQERLLEKMYRREGGDMWPQKEALNYRYSLGSELIDMAKQVGADALLFVRLKEHKRPGLHVTLTYYQVSGWTILYVTLVDGRTGEVLWGNYAFDAGKGLFGEPDFDHKELVTDLLKPFPR